MKIEIDWEGVKAILVGLVGVPVVFLVWYLVALLLVK